MMNIKCTGCTQIHQYTLITVNISDNDTLLN